MITDVSFIGLVKTIDYRMFFFSGLAQALERSFYHLRMVDSFDEVVFSIYPMDE